MEARKMAKGKRGPALFELLGEDGGRTTGGVKVPSLWSRHNRVVELHAARAVRSAAAEESAGPLEAPPSSGATRTGPRPFFEVAGERICVSFTSVAAAVAVFVALAIVLVSYGVGARRGDDAGFRRGFDAGRAAVAAAAGDEIATVRKEPPATYLLGGLLEEAAGKTAGGGVREDRAGPKGVAAATPKTPAVSGSATGWVRDLTYIVAQEFPAASVDKARNAKEFLGQRGVNAELAPLNTGTILLIATQGYNHKDPAQKRLAEQLLDKVRTIGTQYYAAGGGYRLEGYFKTLKRDTW
jgi:hypothetical protein